MLKLTFSIIVVVLFLSVPIGICATTFSPTIFSAETLTDLKLPDPDQPIDIYSNNNYVDLFAALTEIHGVASNQIESDDRFSNMKVVLPIEAFNNLFIVTDINSFSLENFKLPKSGHYITDRNVIVWRQFGETDWEGKAAKRLIGNILLISFSCFLVVLSLTIINNNAFGIAYSNCFRSNKTLSPTRLSREVKKLQHLLLKILLCFLILALIISSVILFINNYVVPVQIAQEIFSAFHINPFIWEYSIEEGVLGDIGEHYEDWCRQKDFSTVYAESMQDFLWNTWFILFPAAIYLLIHLLISSSREIAQLALDYQAKAELRQRNYLKNDLSAKTSKKDKDNHLILLPKRKSRGSRRYRKRKSPFKRFFSQIMQKIKIEN